MKKLKLITALFVMTFVPSLKAELSLKPFKTDGCTLFIDGTNKAPGLWRHCCVEHDLRYWFGGSKEDMDATDVRLKSCVEKVAGSTWANIIYTGVRTGHHSPIKNKTQWNWGWSKKRNYQTLSKEEITIALTELRNLTLTEVNIEDFIEVNFPNQTTP